MTNSVNWKLIRVMSSHEFLGHKCVNVTDYNRYLIQIWYSAQGPHCEHAELCQIDTSWKYNRVAAAILDFQA